MPTLHIPVHHIPERTPVAAQTSEQTTPQITSYHFVLTVQRQNGVASTRSDVLNLPAGTTRVESLNFLTKTLFPNQNVAVLFFSLEPNQL